MLVSRIGFALASLLISVSAHAADAIATSSLSLRDAIAATLAHNPQLTSFTFRRDALAGEITTAGLNPALQFSAELENLAGSGEFKNSQSAELTVALSSVIELGNKREARLGVATARQQQLAVQQQILELDLLADVTQRFIDAVAAQEQLNLQQRALTLVTETTSAVKRRLEAGNTPEADFARAQANQVRVQIELLKAEANFAVTKFKLSALWGETEPAFITVSADLLNTGDIYPLKDLLAILEQNPDIQFFASERRLRDAELRHAMSKRKVDIEWSAGIRRLQANNDSAFVLGVSVPLFNDDRAAGEVATALANQHIAENESNTALLKLRTQLTSLYQERAAALFEVSSLRNDVIPQLKKALIGTRAAFDKGRYGYLELNSAQHELLEAETALIEAAANAHELRTEIERLCGNATTLHSSRNSEVNP